MRVVALAILWLVPALLLFFGFHFNWRLTWSQIGVPAEAVSFPDLRTITSALTTLHNGGDPLVANPSDPWHRPLNYPRAWLRLFSILGINEARVAVVGVTFCGLYLACLSALLMKCKRGVDALLLLVGGLSFAPLYGIELGNTDLLIFSLVLIGCITSSRITRSGAFLAAAILKIFPIVSLPTNAFRRAGKERVVLLLLTGLVAGWFAIQWRDLVAIRHATPVSSEMAYGALSIKEEFAQQSGSLFGLRTSGGWIAVFVCWLAGAGTIVAIWRARLNPTEYHRDSRESALFSTFAVIYISSFAIGSNWDYRLIFLLPTLPLALDHVRNSPVRKWAMAYIALVILAENPLDFRSIYGVALSHIITFLLFLMVLAALILQFKAVNGSPELQ